MRTQTLLLAMAIGLPLAPAASAAAAAVSSVQAVQGPQVAVTVLAGADHAQSWVARLPLVGSHKPVPITPGVLPFTVADGRSAWAIENGALERIDLANGTVTHLPALSYHGARAAIEQFAVGGSTVAFVVAPGGKNQIGYLESSTASVHWLPEPTPHAWTDQVAVSADGSTIGGITYGGNLPPSVTTYDLSTHAFGPGSAAAVTPPDVAYPSPPGIRIPAAAPWFALSPDGKSAVFSTEGLKVEVENLRSGAITSLGTDIAVQGFRWAPDGRAIALWDGQGSDATSFSVRLLTPSGHTLFSGSGGRDADFVETGTGRARLVYTGLTGRTNAMGTFVATVAETGGKSQVLAPGPDVCLDCLVATPAATSPPPTSSSAQPQLYVQTGVVLGELYATPHFPTSIEIDNHDVVTKLVWTSIGRSTAVAVGSYHVDTCTPNCAAGHYQSYAIRLSASHPEACTVKLYNPTTGSLRPRHAYVYDVLVAKVLAGRPPYVPSFPLACPS